MNNAPVNSALVIKTQFVLTYLLTRAFRNKIVLMYWDFSHHVSVSPNDGSFIKFSVIGSFSNQCDINNHHEEDITQREDDQSQEVRTMGPGLSIQTC